MGTWKATLTLLLVMLVGAAIAQDPGHAHRWNAGDGWRYNTGTGTWDIITANAQNLPLGIVRCASSAETESGLQAFTGTYNSTSFKVGGTTGALPETGGLPCFSQQTETRGVNVSLPTSGEEIIWFNFDIRPLAGTYQFQIVTNQNVGWALYYVDPAFAGPTGNTTSGTYPPGYNDPNNLNNISGTLGTNFANLKYADCGVSGNGWSTITVPSFKKPTNYYLAMWQLDPAVTSFPNSTNLVYKSRYGCGGVTCTLEKDGSDQLTCAANGYTVCATYFGSAGKWAVMDNATTKATSYTITTYDQYNNVVSTDNSTNLATDPLYLELGTISWASPQNDIKAVICATYPLGANYDISLQPAGTPSGAPSNYITCTSSGRFSGMGYNAPGAPTTVGDDNCGAGVVNLSASGCDGGTLKWYDAATGGALVNTGATYSPNLTATKSFWVSCTNAQGCEGPRTQVTGTIYTIPGAPTTVSDDNCGAGVVNLSASGCAGGTLKWYDAATGGALVNTGATYSPNLSATKSFWVSCTSADGCEGPRAQVTGTIYTVPDAPTTVGDARCDAGTVNLSASGCTGGTLKWYDAATGGTLVNTGATYSPNLTATKSYWVSCTSAQGCEGPRAQVTGTVNTSPSAPTTVGDDNCGAEVVNLSASGCAGGTLKWYDAATGGSLVNTGATYSPNLTATKSFWVSCTVGDCVSPRTQVIGTIYTIPDAPTTVGDDNCGAGVVNLSASGCTGGTLKWYDAATGGSLVNTGATYAPNISTTTSYWVSCTSAQGCEGPRTQVTGTIYTVPGAPTTVGDARCDAGIVNLSASGCAGGTLKWYDAATGGSLVNTGATYSPNLTMTKSFWVSCTSAQGCEGPRAQVTGTVNNSPSGPITVGDDNCGTGVVNLSASGCDGGTLKWYDAATGGALVNTGATYSPNLTATKSFWVSCTVGDCVSPRTQVTGTIYTVPGAPTTVGDDNCGAGVVNLSASGCAGGTLKWYDAATGGALVNTGATYSPNLSATKSFWVSCTSADGCEGPRAQVTGTIYTVPDAPTTVGDARCDAGTVNLSASGCTSGTLKWYDAATGGSLVNTGATYSPNLTATKSYWVSCTIGDCVSPRTQVTGTIYTIPDAPTLEAIQPTCKLATGTITVKAPLGTGYSYSLDGAAFQTGTSFAGVLPGVHNVRVKNANGCISPAATIAILDQPVTPIPPVLTVIQPSCETLSGTIRVTSPIAGYTYTLNTGASNQTGVFAGLAPGNYTVTVTNTAPCTSAASLPATVNPLPQCGETLCTYTQGQYGTEGGMACTPAGQLTTRGLIDYAIGNWTGDHIVIGTAARSLTIRQNSADVQAILDLLPGGGPSAILQYTGNRYISDPMPSSMLKNGRYNNTLLAQTITLGLNMGITTNLANFQLNSDQWIVTGDPLYGCNTKSTDVKACSYAASKLYSSEVIQFLYNNSWNGTTFATDMSNHKQATVAELFYLASQALGGGNTYGLSLNAIANLEDQINNIFDECQVFIGYMTYDEYINYLMANSCSLPMTTSVDPSAGAVESASDLKVAAYPNPYNHTVSFNFTAPASGKALLEVYDVVGRRLAVVFEGQVDAGMQKVVNYNVPSAQRIPMIYRLSIGGKTSFGKLLPGNTD